MDFSEKWGSSVDNAVELALIDLKLTKDQVDVIVLEEPSKGFFGIGSKLAKVRVEKKSEKPEMASKPEVREESRPARQESRPARQESNPARQESKPFSQESKPFSQESKPFSQESKPFSQESKPARQENRPNRDHHRTYREEVRPAKEEARTIRGDSTVKPFFERSKEPAREKYSEEYKARPTYEKHKKDSNFEGLRQEKPDNLTAVAEDNKVLAFLNEITEKMGLEVTLEAKENEDMIYIDIEGKDSGTIIGKRGQTLDAIQYLTSLVANKGDGKYIKVVVDAENYREKREKTLEQLANRLASKVVKSRKSVRLEPMNPYERKVIHATLQGNPEVTTRSEGEEPYRRVIIDLK